MTDWIYDETWYKYRKVLIALLQGNRKETNQVDDAACQKDAETLKNFGKKWKKEYETINRIFTTRSPAELKAIAEKYKKLTDKTLVKAIEDYLAGDYEHILKNLVRYAISPAEYYAQRVREAVKGAGTNERKLTRVIVTRSGIDMPEIIKAYKKLFDRDMVKDIKSDTTKYYEKTLMALINYKPKF